MKPRLLVDGVTFQWKRSPIARLWSRLLPLLANELEITILDRGNMPQIPLTKALPFPTYTYNYTPADSALLEKFCSHCNADIFISTAYTTPLSTPSLVLIYDMLPEALRLGSARSVLEKELAILYARKRICLSEWVHSDIVEFLGKLDTHTLAIDCVDSAIFYRRSADEVSKFKKRHRIERYYFWNDTGWNRMPQECTDDRIEIFLRAAGIDGAVVLVNCDSFKQSRMKEPSGLIPVKLGACELACALSGADAVILPNPSEGLCLEIAEAQACGCPVLTAEGAARNVTHKDLECLPTEWSPDAITETLKRMRLRSLRAKEDKFRASQSNSLEDASQVILEHIYKLNEENKRGDHRNFLEYWSKLRKLQGEVDF